MNDSMLIIKTLLEAIGLVTTAVAVILFFAAVVGWFLGVGPLLYRLGLGRWRRKVSILADGNRFSTLKADLIDSGVFREKNIDHLTEHDLAKVKDCNLLLLHYESFTANQIKTIIAHKKSEAGLVVYFPEFDPPTKMIPKDITRLINNEPHTVLANFRGRLINDILVTLLSTSYEKK